MGHKDAYKILAVETDDDLETFLGRVLDDLKDNGRGEHPFFMPHSPDKPWPLAEKRTAFRRELSLDLGQVGWRRAWIAWDDQHRAAGHCDLRSAPHELCLHRCLLGIGVHRSHRRRGLGRQLLQHAIEWARREPSLHWLDLEFLGGNLGAERLYRQLGFQETGRAPDFFRIRGQEIENIQMTLRL